MARGIGSLVVLGLLGLSGCGSSDDRSPAGDGDTTGADGEGNGDTTGAGGDGDTTGSDLPDNCDGTELSEWEQMMLDKHNEWRASVAPPAANMHRLRWDAAIAQNAANWVSSCDPDWPHSEEAYRTGVGGYEVLGENLSYCAGTGCSELPTVTDGSGMGDGEGWWEERHDYDWATDESSGVTSHYTQLTSSNVYAIGCATQLCSAPGPSGWDGQWWWTICQYGPRGDAYWVGNKPYEQGDGALIDPPQSVYDAHPDLCEGSE